MPSATTHIWFSGPDEAYLVAAAIRRYLEADVVADLLVVPSSRGPALELPDVALADPVVEGFIKHFGGHVDRRKPAGVVPSSKAGRSDRR